jgi:hypothetical protein
MDTPHQGSFSTDHCKQQGARWTAKGSAYLCLAAGRVGAIGRRGVLAVLRPIWSIALIDTLILRVINRAATPSSTSDQERCPQNRQRDVLRVAVNCRPRLRGSSRVLSDDTREMVGGLYSQLEISLRAGDTIKLPGRTMACDQQVRDSAREEFPRAARHKYGRCLQHPAKYYAIESSGFSWISQRIPKFFVLAGAGIV